jgi:2-desacetyl-2-hydroxyethyl bacteriochlorophyllide A dehydrogenase
VAFVKPREAVLEEFEQEERPGPSEVLVKTLFSVISAGTEGASYSGLELEHPGRPATFDYPRYPGYGNYGEVVAVGSAVKGLTPGDRVLSFARHASYVMVDTGRFALKMPPELDGRRGVFTRMAGVAITALRRAHAAAGDTVMVIGLGLVGNFAAQLFRLAGAEVLGVDTSDFRREKAQACGITRTVNPATEDWREAVMAWTGGEGVRLTVEAIGKAELIAEGVQLTRRHGEIVLLGSPRARLTMDVTPMLSRLHLQGITMIGALEWLYTIPPVNDANARVSITENYRQIAGWIADGRLITEPLLTHLLPPSRCQEAYAGLDGRKEEFLGVVFDWSD